MARNYTTTTNPKVPEAPRSETDAAKVGDNDRQASDVLAATQTALTLKAPGFSEEDSSARTGCNPNVAAWFESIDDDSLYLSVLVLG
ncbi:MAG: hypothetical protein ACK2UP_05205, partial [Candidatus Promineifilaceae bacterium]